MSACPTSNNRLRVTRILSVHAESPTVRTFRFKDERSSKARPGQFLMLWIPHVDEIPLSILDTAKDGSVAVAVKKVGAATRALHDMNVGQPIGVRGPFGNWFTSRTGRLVIVGGGTGVVPLLFLAKSLKAKDTSISLIVGARTEEELLFMGELEKVCSAQNLLATTEDGTRGLKCLATEPLKTMITSARPDLIYACGPEPMIRRVFDLAEEHDVNMEASLERLMRCAIGLCGSCTIGKYRVCRDGPVFTRKELREVRAEFGITKRDFDGTSIHL